MPLSHAGEVGYPYLFPIPIPYHNFVYTPPLSHLITFNHFIFGLPSVPRFISYLISPNYSIVSSLFVFSSISVQYLFFRVYLLLFFLFLKRHRTRRRETALALPHVFITPKLPIIYSLLILSNLVTPRIHLSIFIFMQLSFLFLLSYLTINAQRFIHQCWSLNSFIKLSFHLQYNSYRIRIIITKKRPIILKNI